ncbi:MAG: MBL fold metallo-hydrolase [Phycisphaerae bacterium]|nr:MBL fold metallo-hydrolase [Phycisphaerae bacterium]
MPIDPTNPAPLPRFTFLGTGTSSGVPMIGCSCPVCTSTDPRDARLRTAAALEFRDAKGRDRTVLLDAGPDLRVQALRAGLRRCDAIVFTHNHVDHTFGLDEVRRFNAVQKTPIELHADAHTMEHLRRVYGHIFDRHANVNDSFVADLAPRIVTEDEIERAAPIDLWGARFTPVPLLHGRQRVLGWRIDFEAGLADGGHDADAAGDEGSGGVFPLAYCTDVSAIPPESWKRLIGLKTLVLDALRHRKHPTHLTLEQAVNIAANVGAHRTYFVHMTHDLAHEETQRSLPEGMFLSRDGLVLV